MLIIPITVNDQNPISICAEWNGLSTALPKPLTTLKTKCWMAGLAICRSPPDSIAELDIRCGEKWVSPDRVRLGCHF